MPRHPARRGATSLGPLVLLLVGGMAAGRVWQDRDPQQAVLDDDARAVTSLLLDGRRASLAAEVPLLLEADPQARIIRVAVDRNGDGQVQRPELVGEHILADDVHFGLPTPQTARPFGTDAIDGRSTPDGTEVLQLSPRAAFARTTGLYLATARALPAGSRHADEVVAIELGGTGGAVAAWHADGGGWARRF